MSFEGLSGVQLTIPVFLDVMPHCSVSGYVLNEHTVFLLLGQVGQEEWFRRYILSKHQNYSPNDIVLHPWSNSEIWFWLGQWLPQLRNFADSLKTSSSSQTLICYLKLDSSSDIQAAIFLLLLRNLHKRNVVQIAIQIANHLSLTYL